MSHTETRAPISSSNDSVNEILSAYWKLAIPSSEKYHLAIPSVTYGAFVDASIVPGP